MRSRKIKELINIYNEQELEVKVWLVANIFVIAFGVTFIFGFLFF